MSPFTRAEKVVLSVFAALAIIFLVLSQAAPSLFDFKVSVGGIELFSGNLGTMFWGSIENLNDFIENSIINFVFSINGVILGVLLLVVGFVVAERKHYNKEQ
ncbi:hypothetical protein [Shimazuella alba]|uniref:Uncharacterized protein n=1 Tax=Shimazuella alba TaxID=2690964 RepID=A0A6I4VS75_9BACL|nr:hypothetical protein [Shimazuella alba]MXQ52660.1 hypothetical protein [Shimazuella alba]